MEKAIARISRENHLNHLTKTLPFITVVFVLQCLLIHYFTPQINLGDYALYLALGLVGFVSSMVYYDNNHHVFFYPDHIRVFFALTGTDRKIFYHEIEHVEGPKEECHFSTLVIRLKDNDSMVFFFVDYPLLVKQLIDDHCGSKDESEQDAA